MPSSFLPPVLALVGPGGAAMAQLQRRDSSKKHLELQLRQWLCLSVHGEQKAVARRSPKARAGMGGPRGGEAALAPETPWELSCRFRAGL